jgi:tripartite-type tricarboxylate transporter receptor subunit TctC
MHRRHLMLGTGAALVAPMLARAQDYPSKPVRWVVPFAAGGPNDAIARKLAELAAARIGQPILIDNKPGASGSLGTREVMTATPDGYTFGIGILDSLVSAPYIVRSARYDTRSDFTPIVNIADAMGAFVARTELGTATMRELAHLARQRPDTIAYASYGPGSTPHLAMSAIEQQSQSRFVNVPYKGLAPAMADFYGKQIHMVMVPLPLAQQIVDKGAGVPVAIVGSERSPRFPSASTLAEQGFDVPLLRSNVWVGLFGPKGLPQPIVERWVKELTAAIRTPAFVEALAVVGFQPLAKPAAEFQAQLTAEFNATGALVRSIGLQPE